MPDSQSSPARHASDPALIQGCLRGDEQAWSDLVARYSHLIYSVARRTGLSPEDSDDVTQTVFTIVLRRLEALQDQTRLSSWLITTTYRESWRVARQAPGHEGLPDPALLVDDGARPETAVLAWEEAHEVHLALSRIDDRCRELLTALFLDPAPPSYEEIADRLGMRVGSIGPTRARCFRKLAAELTAIGGAARAGVEPANLSRKVG
jgi:RNA polymerase sigma factor (sigma-70 family)